MDTFPWAELKWLLYPLLVAGIVGVVVALSSAEKRLATKRAFLTTWGLGIVLGSFAGTFNEAEYAVVVIPILLVPLGLLAGGVVAVACGIAINLRDSGNNGDSVSVPPKIATRKTYTEPIYGIGDPMAEQLRETYASVDTNELVELRARGTLTEMAQKVIEQELRARER